MKKSIVEHTKKLSKLSLRSETVRILTERELALVAAGNCLNGSHQTQSKIATSLDATC